MGCGVLSRWRSSSELRARAPNRHRPRNPRRRPQPASDTRREPASVVAAVRIVTEDGKVLAEARRRDFDPDGQAAGPRSGGGQPPGALPHRATMPICARSRRRLKAGVRIDFVVREQLFFNQVLIRGLVAPPTDASAAAAMQLSLGQPYRQDAVDEGVARLRDTLHDEGLYAAEVSVETVPHRGHASDGRHRSREVWTASAREGNPAQERHGIPRRGDSVATEDEAGAGAYRRQEFSEAPSAYASFW